ncbi:Exoenzyme S synthesis regulatory protein ExsA [compost metagenome]
MLLAKGRDVCCGACRFPRPQPRLDNRTVTALSFWHSMTWHTEGISVTAPVKWRQFDGLVSAFWEAESQMGAKGYYLAADPRIMIFFNDVSSRIRISNRDGELSQHSRPMTRAVYVPAGMPMWTSSNATHRFSHLNLHIHKDRLLRFLSPAVGGSAAMTALRRPVEIQDIGAVETLAGLLVDELAEPAKHPLYAESLVGGIVAGLLDIPGPTPEQANGRLTQAQMNRLLARVEKRGDDRMTVAEMADIVGLSESWFATVFRQTTGKTPLQWQLERRINAAQKLLLEGDLTVADIAAQLGFSDQAHLTKAFRHSVGDTPAAWRRMHRLL